MSGWGRLHVVSRTNHRERRGNEAPSSPVGSLGTHCCQQSKKIWEAFFLFFFQLLWNKIKKIKNLCFLLGRPIQKLKMDSGKKIYTFFPACRFANLWELIFFNKLLKKFATFSQWTPTLANAGIHLLLLHLLALRAHLVSSRSYIHHASGKIKISILQNFSAKIFCFYFMKGAKADIYFCLFLFFQKIK